MCVYETLLSMKHEEEFVLQEQGDGDYIMTFKKCFTDNGKLNSKWKCRIQRSTVSCLNRLSNFLHLLSIWLGLF